MSDSQNSANAGIGLSTWFGIILGPVVPTIDLGWSGNPLNGRSVYGSSRDLTRFHFGLGLQFEPGNKNALVVQVLGAMVDFNRPFRHSEWWLSPYAAVSFRR